MTTELELKAYKLGEVRELNGTIRREVIHKSIQRKHFSCEKNERLIPKDFLFTQPVMEKGRQMQRSAGSELSMRHRDKELSGSCHRGQFSEERSFTNASKKLGFPPRPPCILFQFGYKMLSNFVKVEIWIVIFHH